MSLQAELFEHLAQDCLHAAERTKDPQTRELLLGHAVQWMQDALAALKQSDGQGLERASAVTPSDRDSSPAPHGPRNGQRKRPSDYETETRTPRRRPPWLATRSKCLARNSKIRTRRKATKKRRGG